MNKQFDGLDQAIKDFNNWSKNAKLYFNRKERYFDVEVFINDVQATGTLFSDDCVVVYGKSETEGDKKIGEKRRKYIEKYIEMLDDGWEPYQIDYQLSEAWS